MITKIIHQTHATPEKLPVEIKKNIEYLQARNKAWKYKIYNDEEVRAYIKKFLGQASAGAIEKVNKKYGVVLADLFRYIVVYNEGGVYLDVKSTCKNSLDSLLIPTDEYLLSQWPNRVGEKYCGAGLHAELSRIPGGEFQQWHVIGRAQHPFLEAVIKNVLFNIENYHLSWCGVGKTGVLRLSGPICYSLSIFPILHKHKCRIVFPSSSGLQYSIYEELGDKDFHSKDPSHYSKLKELIIL